MESLLIVSVCYYLNFYYYLNVLFIVISVQYKHINMIFTTPSPNRLIYHFPPPWREARPLNTLPRTYVHYAICIYTITHFCTIFTQFFPPCLPVLWLLSRPFCYMTFRLVSNGMVVLKATEQPACLDFSPILFSLSHRITPVHLPSFC